MSELTVDALMTALSEIQPSWILVKNSVGNLSILDESGTYVGFVDLQTGEVNIHE